MRNQVSGSVRLLRTAIAPILGIVPLTLSAAQEADFRWSQEVGYYTINPNVDSSEISGPGLPPNTAVDVDDGGSYLLSSSYHLTNNLSIEFFYSGWNELDVAADGSVSFLGEVASFEYLSPTLMVNWTLGDSTWLIQPFVGIGINRMIYSNEKAKDKLSSALGGPTDMHIDDTWGAAFTTGLTGNITDQIYVTAAYVLIGTDTTATLTTDQVGTQRDVDLDTDLNIVYLNLGYRF